MMKKCSLENQDHTKSSSEMRIGMFDYILEQRFVCLFCLFDF